MIPPMPAPSLPADQATMVDDHQPGMPSNARVAADHLGARFGWN